MCGFVGFHSLQDFKTLKADLPKAALSLAHRGPDDSGLFVDEHSGVGLGHRRLSVIDLTSAGHQPMKSPDEKVQLVYNGEIYNFKEIRQTLEGLGHRFRSNTDSEVVLNAYLQWGKDALKKFIGMFAIAIWDARTNCLFLARDRLGIKPLFYYYHNKRFIFSSELKAIMAFNGFTKELDPDAIPLFFHYQYIPAPRTIFKYTYKLLPGHYLTYDGHDMKVQSYWSLPVRLGSTDMVSNEEESIVHLDHLLTQAVSDRLISDVPLGALLSGGIDSSVVVALAQKVNHSPIRTFSIGFKETGYDEAPWASKIANHLGTDHTELYVTPKAALEVIPRLPEIYDEPFADSSAIPTFLVSQLTRSYVTVALSGDGGDEQFAGYVRYWTTVAMVNGLGYVPLFVRKSLANILKFIPITLAEKCYGPWRRILPQRFNVANFSDKWEKLINQMRNTRIDEIYRMTICHWTENELLALTGKQMPASQFEETFNNTVTWPVLSRLMRVDQATYLPDAMLTKVDRASMAVSLEIRVPLLDHRVVEYTSTLDESLKYRNGRAKYLLRKLLARYIPTKLFERPKMGFGVPLDLWFRKPLKELLLDHLSPVRLKKEGLFNHALVEKKVKAHLSGQANHQYRLWSLLTWEMWREKWLAA